MHPPRYHYTRNLYGYETIKPNLNWAVKDRRRNDTIVITFPTRREARNYCYRANAEQDKFDLLQEAQKAESFDPTLSPYKE